MKRLLLLLALAVLVAVPAALAGSSTFSASATKFEPFVYAFDAPAGGDVTIAVTFAPKRGGAYSLNVDPTACWDGVSYPTWDKSAVVPASVTLTCTDTSGAGGHYQFSFTASTAQPTLASVTITTP